MNVHYERHEFARGIARKVQYRRRRDLELTAATGGSLLLLEAFYVSTGVHWVTRFFFFIFFFSWMAERLSRRGRRYVQRKKKIWLTQLNPNLNTVKQIILLKQKY